MDTCHDAEEEEVDDLQAKAKRFFEGGPTARAVANTAAMTYLTAGEVAPYEAAVIVSKLDAPLTTANINGLVRLDVCTAIGGDALLAAIKAAGTSGNTTGDLTEDELRERCQNALLLFDAARIGDPGHVVCAQRR